jgi:peroxiredoxin
MPVRPLALRLTAAVFLAGALTLTAGCQSGDDEPGQTPGTAASGTAQTASQGYISKSVDPHPVADLELTTLDGDTIALEAQKGSVLLINFWATWCPPCRKEIPDLVDLQEELGPRGLQVIGVSFDREGAEVVRPFVEERDVNYPIVADTSQSVESELGPIYGLPTTLVVDADGMVRRRIVGVFPVDKMRSTLDSMLTAGASGAGPASGAGS